jgi:hypothetical protein
VIVSTPTATPEGMAALVVGGGPDEAASVPSESVDPASVQPLWGAAAVVLSYAATNYALSRLTQRQQAVERMRREVARSAAKNTIENRMARLVRRYRPPAVIVPRVTEEEPEPEDIYADEDDFVLSGAAAATAERWEAIGDYYREKEESEAARKAATEARERAHAARRQEVAESKARELARESTPPTSATEPVLEPVPSFWSNPLGWAQANIINAGRSDEGVGRAITGILSPLIDPLRGRGSGKQASETSSTASTTQLQQRIGTPTPEPRVIPVPTPPMSTTPTPDLLTPYQIQQARNSRYGFCVYPLTDPDANENKIVEGGLAFGQPPIQLLPGLPDEPGAGIVAHPIGLIAKAADLFNSTFGNLANARYLENLEPNVQLELYYSTYDEGVRVPGMRVENNSDVPVLISRVDVDEWKVLSEQISFPETKSQLTPGTVIQPGEFEFIEFDLEDSLITEGYRAFVRIQAVSVSSMPMWRQIGFAVYPQGGAVELPSGW